MAEHIQAPVSAVGSEYPADWTRSGTWTAASVASGVYGPDNVAVAELTGDSMDDIIAAGTSDFSIMVAQGGAAFTPVVTANPFGFTAYYTQPWGAHVTSASTRDIALLAQPLSDPHQLLLRHHGSPSSTEVATLPLTVDTGISNRPMFIGDLNAHTGADVVFSSDSSLLLWRSKD